MHGLLVFRFYQSGRTMASSLLHGRLLLPLLLSSLLLLASHCPGSAASKPIHEICDGSAGNYTGNSTFQDNLGRLLSSLSSTAPATGYSNDTVGRTPDQVYGLALCRGDIAAAQCRECLAGAVPGVAEVCPYSKAATIWYEKCHLRYSDNSFFGLPTETSDYTWNSGNVSDPEAHGRILGELLGGLTSRAARSPRMFAAGEVNDTTYGKVYGLVQCTRDLAPDDCELCLRREISSVLGCCKGKQGLTVIGGSCNLRYDEGPFYNTTAAADPPPPASSPVPGSATTPAASLYPEKKDNTSKIAMAITFPLIISVVAIIAICICIWRREKERILSGKREGETGPAECLLFDLKTLRFATEKFSDLNKLGEGGFGAVYKGLLPNGQQIAVKRLSRNSEQGLGELRNEVHLVSKLQHRNLVRLLGYCLGDQEKLLVYEYLQNKSLDGFLFDPVRSRHLNWETRVKIIEGIARGLLYLHEDSRLKVIHRDLKAKNILLDEDMNPKISDFGLAKLFGNEQSRGNTSRAAGTYGYMAPEYVMHGQISTKSDVYSFGVLVLEIVTGRKCVGFHGSTPCVDLVSYVWQHWDEGHAVRVLDRNVIDGYSTQEVLRCIHVALLCIQHDPQERPDMSSVVLMLSSYSVALPTISSLAYFGYRSTNPSGDAFMDDPHSNSEDGEGSKRSTN